MKFKKKAAYLICICAFSVLFSISVFASSYGVDELREYIPDDLLSLLPEDAFSEDGEKSAAAVAKISGFSFILKFLFSSFSSAVPAATSFLFTVIGLAIISAIVKLFGEHIKSKAVLSAFDTCFLLCFAAMVFKTQYLLIAAAEEYLSSLSIFVGGMIPIMSAVYASGGNLSLAAVNGTGMMMFLSVCEVLCLGVLLPLIKICYGLSVATLISGGVNLGAITKLIKKTATFALGLVSVVVAAVMAFQSVLAQGADTTASKILKFSFGTLVPVVGGAIGDSVKTLSAGLSLVKSTVGVLGITVIAFMLLPLIVKLFLHKVALGAAGAFCSLLGCKKEENFFSEVAGLQNMVIAVCVLSSLMFTVAIGVFISSTLALGA